MIFRLNIIPGIGLGDIKFGMTRARILEMLGPADSTEIVDYLKEDDDTTESWNYKRLGIELNFCSYENFLLTWIDVQSGAYLLYGTPLIGESMDGLLKFLDSREVAYTTEDVYPIDVRDWKLIRVDIWAMDFHVKDGEVADIEWGPLWKDENTQIWPELD